MNSKFLVENYKTSDTLFILASGGSVNKIDKNKWKSIQDNDSIGFNFWPIHDFIPTYYSFEIPREKLRKKNLENILSLRAAEYKHTPIFIKDVVNKPGELKDFQFPELLSDNLHALNDHTIPGKTEKEFLKSIEILSKKGGLKQSQIIKKLYKKRASLSYLIIFGFLAGYKNIVLTGVDLNNTAYFWEKSDFTSKLVQEIDLPSTGQSGNVHKTVDQNYGNLTIDTTIDILNKKILKPNDVNLYIESKSSKLFPMLPHYWS